MDLRLSTQSEVQRAVTDQVRESGHESVSTHVALQPGIWQCFVPPSEP
jgi:hypothetical protein